jgi:hypothetical protein
MPIAERETAWAKQTHRKAKHGGQMDPIRKVILDIQEKPAYERVDKGDQTQRF